MKLLIIQTLILCAFSIAHCNAQDIELYRSDKGKYGFKDNAGKTVLPAKYDLVHGPNVLNIYQVNIGAKFDDAAGQYYGGKWGIVNAKGIEIIIPQYDIMEPFYEGLAAVNIGAKYDDDYGTYDGGKWGFVDTYGKEIITVKYDNFYDDPPVFVGGRAKVRLGDIEFYIDQTGKEIK